MPRAGENASKLVFVGAALALIAIGVLRLVSLATSGHLNSDLLYIANVHRDLFVHPRPMQRWYLPPAPYFFPDMALLFPLLSMLGSLESGYLAYGIVLFGVFLGVVTLAARTLGLGPRSSLLATLGAAVVFLSAMQGAHLASLVFFLPIFHAGSTVVGFALVTLVMRAVAGGYSRRASLAFFALTVAITLSDMFSVTQFVLPILITVLLMPRQLAHSAAAARRTWMLIIAAALLDVVILLAVGALWPVHFLGNPLLASTRLLAAPLPLTLLGVLVLVGYLFGRRVTRRQLAIASAIGLGLLLVALALALGRPEWLARLPPDVRPPIGWPLSTARAFARDLRVLAAHDPGLWVMAALCPLLCVASAVHLARKLRSTAFVATTGMKVEATGTAETALRFLLTFIPISTAMILIEAALTWVGLGNQVFAHLDIFNEGTVRHIQPVYVLPPFVLTLLAAAAWRRLSDHGARAALAATAGAGILLVGALAIRPLALPYRAAFVTAANARAQRCLDDFVASHGLHAGYGDYWTARHFTLLSRGDVHLSPLRLGTMGLEPWVYNPAWFLPDGAPSTADYLEYDYFVASRFPESQIKERFGAPSARGQCGDLAILVYDRPGDVAFRNFLRVPSLLENGARPEALLTVMIQPEFPNEWSADRTPMTTVKTLQLDEAPPLSMPLTHPISRGEAGILEISALGDRSFEVVTVNERGERSAPMEVPAVKGAAGSKELRARFLLLKRSDDSIVRVVIRNTDGRGPSQIGHLYVYPDSRQRP